MSSLGTIILRNLQTYYPADNINLTPDTIDNILIRAQLDKKKSTKKDISKVIKILRNHIDTAKKNKINNKNLNQKIFKDMDSENDVLQKMNLDYLDNFNKLKQQDMNFQPKKVDIISPQDRVNTVMEERDKEFDHIIMIDSQDRNKEQYPLPNQYSILLGAGDFDTKGCIKKEFPNIISLELNQIFIKKNIMNSKENPYLIIEVEEMGGLLNGTNPNLNQASYLLLDSDDRNPYLKYKLQEGECKIYYDTTINLNNISLKIKNYDGSLYEFEEESESKTLNTFMFTITTRQKNLVSNLIQP